VRETGILAVKRLLIKVVNLGRVVSLKPLLLTPLLLMLTPIPYTWFRCLVKDVRGMIIDKGNKSSSGMKWNKKSKYVWYEMTFITRWQPGCCIMLCINTPDDMQQDLEAVLSNGSATMDFDDPFCMYIPLMDEVVKQYEISVWAIRDVLRPIEKV